MLPGLNRKLWAPRLDPNYARDSKPEAADLEPYAPDSKPQSPGTISRVRIRRDVVSFSSAIRHLDLSSGLIIRA